MSALSDRWAVLPRAARWLIMAGAFVAAYFVVVEPALVWTERLDTKADILQSGLERERERRGAESDAGQTLARGASQFGDVLPPGRAERSGVLNARIEEALRGRAVSGLSIKARAPLPLGRASMAGVIGENEQVQRLILDLDFEAPPEVAMSILAELERSKEVASVGRVILRRVEKDGQKLVQASVSPEAWIIAPRGERR